MADSLYSTLKTCDKMKQDCDTALDILAKENFNISTQLNLNKVLLADSDTKVVKQQKKIGRLKVIRNFLFGICATEALVIAGRVVLNH